MQKVLELVDRDLIPCPPARLFPRLLDVRSYGSWWPGDVSFELKGEAAFADVGSELIMRPPMMEVWARVIQIDRPILIVWDLFRGSYVGSARWELSPLADGTDLAFRMAVRWRSTMMRLGSMFVDVRAEHSLALQKAFEGLKRLVGGSR